MKLHKSITNLLDTNYNLSYVERDYNPLDGDEVTIQAAIHFQSMEPFETSLMDYHREVEDENMDFELVRLEDELMKKFKVSRQRAKSFVYKYRELVEEEIFSRDSSDDFFKTCLNNYGKAVMFYSLSMWVDAEDGFALEGLREALKITDSSYDELLYELINNSYGGGELCIFFRDCPERYMKIVGDTLNFKNPHVVLFNSTAGAGHDVF